MAATMERFVAVVKQYPGQQQVHLAVEIEVPGSWFGAGPMGSLTATEQRQKYKAQAVEYAEVHEFPGATKGARKASVQLQGCLVLSAALFRGNGVIHRGHKPIQGDDNGHVGRHCQVSPAPLVLRAEDMWQRHNVSK